MDEATLERHLHLTMTLIGGFMGGYAILNRHDVFGSAQTGNMISLAMDAVGHPDEQWFFRVLAMVIYIVSMAATVVISHKISKITQKRLSILIDGVVLLIIGFYPEEMNPFVALFPIFFATAFQWCSFKGADGFASSSIFSTNNLRQCVTGFTEYLCSKDTESLRRGIYFGKVLICFYGGAAIAFLSCAWIGLKGAWIAILPTVAAFVMCNAEYVLYDVKKKDILKASA